MQNSSLNGTLHILNKSPGHARFSACLTHVLADDALVLLEDGVLGAQHPLLRQLPASVTVYILEADAQARGLARLSATSSCDSASGSSIKWCDMLMLVKLTESHPHIINW